MNCDCHVHMILDGVYYKDAINSHRAEVQTPLVEERLAAYRDAGITYLRDGGDAWGVALYARSIAPHYGITYTAPAFPIHRLGRYGGFIGRGYKNREEFLSLLDEAEEKEADFIKIMFSGLMDFEIAGKLSCPPLEYEEMAELTALSHERGFQVMVHVNGNEAIDNALKAGVDSIEHGNFMRKDTLLRLADSGAVWVPTMAPAANIIHAGRFPAAALQEITDRQSESIAFAAAHGALIAPGSDAGAWLVPHADGTRDEYAHLRSVLGKSTDTVLTRGADEIMRRFRRT